MRRRFDDARNALEIINSIRLNSIIIALKPTYLELYSNISADFPEIQSETISYDKGKIKTIIKKYGSEIKEFNELYQKYVRRSSDRIAQILWSKEPTPFTVRTFYNELRNKRSELLQGNSKAVRIAESLLHNDDYYKAIFSNIYNSKERRSELDFLYTLKLRYELKLKRSTNISILQKELFESESPREPLAFAKYLDIFV